MRSLLELWGCWRRDLARLDGDVWADGRVNGLALPLPFVEWFHPCKSHC